jgi:hypothetical protein
MRGINGGSLVSTVYTTLLHLLFFRFRCVIVTCRSPVQWSSDQAFGILKLFFLLACVKSIFCAIFEFHVLTQEERTVDPSKESKRGRSMRAIRDDHNSETTREAIAVYALEDG